MKAQKSILFVFISLFILISSCKKEEHINSNERIIFGSEQLCIENPDNPYEHYGKYVRDCYLFVSADQILQSLDEPTFDEYWSSFETFISDNPFDNIVDSSSITDFEMSFVDDMFDLTNIIDFEEYCDSIINLENQIINHSYLENNQKARLLATSSLIKYSYYSVVNGDPIVGIAFTPNIDVFHNYFRMCVSDRINSMNGWQKTAFFTGMPINWLWLSAECTHWAYNQMKSTTTN